MVNTFTRPVYFPPPSFQLSRLTKYEKKKKLAGKENKALSVMKPRLLKYLLVISEYYVQRDYKLVCFKCGAKKCLHFVTRSCKELSVCGFKIDFARSDNSTTGKNLLILLILFHRTFLYNFRHKIVSEFTF